jgi:hypothetical protein
MSAKAAIVITTRKITALYNGRSPFPRVSAQRMSAPPRPARPAYPLAATRVVISARLAVAMSRAPPNAPCGCCRLGMPKSGAIRPQSWPIARSARLRRFISPRSTTPARLTAHNVFVQRRSTHRHSHKFTRATLLWGIHNAHERADHRSSKHNPSGHRHRTADRRDRSRRHVAVAPLTASGDSRRGRHRRARARRQSWRSGGFPTK